MRPVSRWNAVASGRPESGCSTTVTSYSRPCSRFAVSTVTAGLTAPSTGTPSLASAARTAAAWSRWAVPTATRSAVSGADPCSEWAVSPRSSSRRTVAATAATACGSVRTVCRAGSSSRAQPCSAARSIAASSAEPSGRTAEVSRRSPGPVPERNGVNG